MGMQLLEDTHPPVEARAVEGSKLFTDLVGVEDLTFRDSMIFDASTEGAMNNAIRVLLKSGYVPDEVPMVEGHFYSVRFVPSWKFYPAIDRWPHWVVLRYLTHRISHVPLALARRSENLYLWYRGSYNVTLGTGSSDAEKMRFHFEHDHPGVAPVWVPIFDRTPLLLERDS
ncbi:MAG: hypothetical protein WBP22_00985 [Candidatus Saccharimonas sp.]